MEGRKCRGYKNTIEYGWCIWELQRKKDRWCHYCQITMDTCGHMFDRLQKKKYRDKSAEIKDVLQNRRAELQNDRVIKNGLVISYYQYLIYLIERHCM